MTFSAYIAASGTPRERTDNGKVESWTGEWIGHWYTVSRTRRRGTMHGWYTMHSVKCFINIPGVLIGWYHGRYNEDGQSAVNLRPYRRQP